MSTEFFQEQSFLQVFCKKAVLKNFAKFTGRRPETLLKKRVRLRYFPLNFAKFLETLFLYRTPPMATSQKQLVFLEILQKKGKQLCQSLFITKEKFLGTHLIQITFGRLLLVSVLFSVKFQAEAKNNSVKDIFLQAL